MTLFKKIVNQVGLFMPILAAIGFPLATICLVTGCASGTAIAELGTMKKPVGPVDVRLIPFDPYRLDRVFQGGRPGKWGSIQTGPYWTRVFSNDPKSKVVFELVDARPHWDIGVGGWAAIYKYEVRGVFRCGDMSEEVNEHFSETTAFGGPINGLGGVVNDALVYLANKSRNFAAECDTSRSTITAPSRNRYDDIAQLKNLLDSGAITEDEYQREKAMILDSGKD